MKMLRSLTLSLALLGAAVTPALADGVATVNIQEIMHESTAAKSVRDQLEAKQKAFQSEMSKKESELQHEDQDLGKERSVLAPEAFDRKLKDFRSRATAAQKEVQTKRAELDNALSSSLSQIQKSVYDIVGDMAKQKGYSVVMPTSQLLYADPKLDITKEVLSKLNSTLPKVTVSFKAPAAASSNSSRDEE